MVLFPCSPMHQKVTGSVKNLLKIRPTKAKATFFNFQI